MLNYSPIPSTPAGSIHPIKEAGAPWRMLVLSLVLLGLCVLIYAGITFGYAPYMQKQVTTADTQLATLTQSLNTQQQNDLVTLYSQLYNIKFLSTQHILSSKVFAFIEKDTANTVVYTSMNVVPSDGTLLLQGTAPDFDTINAQLAAFQHDTASVVSASLTSAQAQQQQSGSPVVNAFSMKLKMVNGFFQ